MPQGYPDNGWAIKIIHYQDNLGVSKDRDAALPVSNALVL